MLFKTIIGSVYNSNSGLFTAPTDGTYVVWTMLSDVHSYTFTQLVINSSPFASTIVNSEEVYGVHSGTKVVVNLTRGDVVFVRTHPTAISKGNVRSDATHGQPSFCGWKL